MKRWHWVSIAFLFIAALGLALRLMWAARYDVGPF